MSETKNFESEARFLGPMLTGLVSRSSNTAKVHRLFRDGNATESDFRAAIKDQKDLRSGISELWDHVSQLV